MTGSTHTTTFADVVSLRDQVASAPLDMPEAQFEALADRKHDAVMAAIYDGNVDDALRAVVLLASEGIDVEPFAIDLMARIA